MLLGMQSKRGEIGLLSDFLRKTDDYFIFLCLTNFRLLDAQIPIEIQSKQSPTTLTLGMINKVLINDFRNDA